MNKILKARKSGFTLVELLIVIMIIAILAGMMLLATGSATDSATATKIINDMRAAKSAALLIYMDENQNWDFTNDTDAFKTSLDKYMDRPLFGDNSYYSDIEVKEDDIPTSEAGATSKRDLIGFTINTGVATPGVQEKLQQNATKAGLYDGNKGFFKAGDGKTAPTVYMVLH